ncbi:methyltransferase domain-containing protein [Methanolobus zinderi]|uniref:Methyltransferase domain-containing protein n=1 Tax=Methanolobus zinderi TaxID=536044 RepID=A0A7D5E7F6_9EURY|nr:class I SAM-dependent methyltransferase [Methanolobus zinderi]QLC50613.1 methyltransferase domain-containing protein [Methanolobus zinderi]
MDPQDIDWNNVWKEQLRKHQESSNRKECASIWEEKDAARRFWEMTQRDGNKRARKTIEGLNITPESRVLDIGAGPGSLAIPLSQKVAHVTAVEPSTGMVEVLKENMEEKECDNISIIKKRWEDIDTEKDLEGPYDIIIASFSLGMPDIRKAIEDMEAVSSGYIYLYWFAGERSWDRYSKEIWPKLHRKEYKPSPKCDVLYNVLYQMGIYPNMETFTLGRTEAYSTPNEAMENLSNHFALKNDKQKKILEQYLESKLRNEHGNYIHDARSTRVKIWWKNKKEKK